MVGLSAPQGWDSARLARFIDTRFQSWGTNVTAGLVDTYVGIANASAHDGTFGYYSLDSDIGITCGTRAVAHAAALHE